MRADVPLLAAVDLDGVDREVGDQERVATMNVDAIVTGAHLVRALDAAADSEDEEDDAGDLDERESGAWYQ